MSTRSTTHFIDAGCTQPTAIIYRHSDGYPEGAGKDLVQFIERVKSLPDGRLGDASYLAAKYVVFLAEMFATNYTCENGEWKETPKEDRLDFLSVGILDDDPSDIDYRYIVTCSARPTLECFAVRHDYKTNRWASATLTAIPENPYEKGGS